jgi:hypothetical protein
MLPSPIRRECGRSGIAQRAISKNPMKIARNARPTELPGMLIVANSGGIVGFRTLVGCLGHGTATGLGLAAP